MSILLMAAAFITGILTGSVIMALCVASGYAQKNEER